MAARYSGASMLFRAASLLVLLAQISYPAAFRHGQKKGEDQESMRPNPAAASVDAGAMASCPAGSPIGELSLLVKSVSGDKPLPFANIIHLTEGDTVFYTPYDRGRAKRAGEVSLVLVPTKISGKEELLITDPKDAGKPQQWQIPRAISLAVFVYGPQGLSSKRVRSFLSQDQSLVAQLAEYADKTTQTEALISALSNSESSSASVNAALSGFASQYGVSVQLDKTAPPGQQAQALFAAMNPQLANYSPLSSSGAGRASQTASLATAAAGLFFGSPVGLLAGGTGMLLDLRSIAFPDTQFRSSFSLPLKNNHMNLCGERGSTPPHTRLAYIWATRMPDVPKPDVQIGNANYVPIKQKSPVPVTLDETDWKFLQRARDWYLKDSNGTRTPVGVVKLQNQKAIEVDLTKAQISSGDYQIGGYWDWANFEARGDIHVLLPADMSHAQLLPASQDKLLANSGKQPITVTGSDFEFTTRMEMKRVGDEFAVAQPLRFILPLGLRRGPQDTVDVLVDTKGMDPGEYQLFVTQTDERSQPVSFRLLPNPPRIANLPILVNAGAAAQHFVLKGERLDQVTGLLSPGVQFQLTPATGNNNERSVLVQMSSSAQPGTKLPVSVNVRDRSQPMTFPEGLEVAGPLPVIASSKLASPAGQTITLAPDEFPAGATLSATLDVKNVTPQSSLSFGCSESQGSSIQLSLGQETERNRLQQLSPDQLYVLLDTSGYPAGCNLQAVVDNGRGGRSQPYSLAHMIRLPQIDSFEPQGDGKTQFLLKGRNLEMIERAGWDPSAGTAVTALPTPLPGEGQRQSLPLDLAPVQTGKEELYVWLRGDKEARTTTWKAPSPPPPPTPAAPLSKAN